MTAPIFKEQEHYTEMDAVRDVLNAVNEHHDLTAVTSAQIASKRRSGFFEFFKPKITEKPGLTRPSADNIKAPQSPKK